MGDFEGFLLVDTGAQVGCGLEALLCFGMSEGHVLRTWLLVFLSFCWRLLGYLLLLAVIRSDTFSNSRVSTCIDLSTLELTELRSLFLSSSFRYLAWGVQAPIP